MSASLRERLITLADGMAASADMRRCIDEHGMAAARIALTMYAEKMERAGQPAAALGAVLFAERECSAAADLGAT